MLSSSDPDRIRQRSQSAIGRTFRGWRAEAQPKEIYTLGTHADPAAVILDLEQLETAIFHRNPDCLGARVQAVFNELLERVGRPLDNLEIVEPSAAAVLETRRSSHGRTSPAAIRFTTESSSARIGLGSKAFGC